MGSRSCWRGQSTISRASGRAGSPRVSPVSHRPRVRPISSAMTVAGRQSPPATAPSSASSEPAESRVSRTSARGLLLTFVPLENRQFSRALFELGVNDGQLCVVPRRDATAGGTRFLLRRIDQTKQETLGLIELSGPLQTAHFVDVRRIVSTVNVTRLIHLVAIPRPN